MDACLNRLVFRILFFSSEKKKNKLKLKAYQRGSAFLNCMAPLMSRTKHLPYIIVERSEAYLSGFLGESEEVWSIV